MPTWHSIITTLIVVCLVPVATPVDAAEPADSIELAFVPEGTSSDGPDVEGFGVRYTHRFDGVWGIQAAYYRDDVAFTDDDEMVEVSARLRLFDNDRTEVFTYFGGGLLRYERFSIDPAANTIPNLGTDELVTIHAGLGADIDVSERLFVRPDIVHRRFNNLFAPRDEEDTRLSLAVGLRF